MDKSLNVVKKQSGSLEERGVGIVGTMFKALTRLQQQGLLRHCLSLRSFAMAYSRC
jgi:hypothetical protein